MHVQTIVNICLVEQVDDGFKGAPLRRYCAHLGFEKGLTLGLLVNVKLDDWRALFASKYILCYEL